MHRATMDPAEAVAHLVAHDIRAPIFLAAELLRMTADDGRTDPDLVDLTARLDAVVDGLSAAGTVCDEVVASLRPKPADAATGPVAEVAAALWPGHDLAITGDGPGDGLLAEVVRDLAVVAPAPHRVSIVVGDPTTCRLTAAGVEDTREACLALSRIARRVGALELHGGDLRVGREGNEFVIDVRLPRGGDRP